MVAKEQRRLYYTSEITDRDAEKTDRGDFIAEIIRLNTKEIQYRRNIIKRNKCMLEKKKIRDPMYPFCARSLYTTVHVVRAYGTYVYTIIRITRKREHQRVAGFVGPENNLISEVPSAYANENNNNNNM